jgi:hypothetical protein
VSGLALADIGFADRAVIRPLIRRIAVKGAVAEARASIEALLDLLTEEREPLRRHGATPGEELIGLPGGDEQGGVSGAAIDRRKSDAVREDELLEGVELIAQLLDRIEIGVRHGLFSCAGDEQANRDADQAHRLCGGAK